MNTLVGRSPSLHLYFNIECSSVELYSITMLVLFATGTKSFLQSAACQRMHVVCLLPVRALYAMKLHVNVCMTNKRFGNDLVCCYFKIIHITTRLH